MFSAAFAMLKAVPWYVYPMAALAIALGVSVIKLRIDSADLRAAVANEAVFQSAQATQLDHIKKLEKANTRFVAACTLDKHALRTAVANALAFANRQTHERAVAESKLENIYANQITRRWADTSVPGSVEQWVRTNAGGSQG